MEVNEVRRGGRIISAGMPTGKKSSLGAASGAARSDKLALSRQVVAYLEERNRAAMEEARVREGGTQQENLLKAMEKDLKGLNKCQKIYARVASGDKVPPEDLRYLERHDPEGFKLALAMRRPKKHPKEWESVLDDEDRRELAEDPSGGGSSVEAIAPAGGGSKP